MHILLGILGAIGAILTILWRIKMAAEATRAIASTAKDAKNYMRRRNLEKKANADPIKEIEDPREAAAAMMAALASHDGAMSEREENTIINEIKNNFEANENVAQELLTHGRWLSRDMSELNLFLSRLLPPIVRHCSLKEKHELISMLENTANANGTASALEADAILFVKRHLGL